MKITFRGQELEMHYSMRIYIIYENIMGTGIGFKNDLQSYTSALTLFYAALLATLQYNKLNTDVSYDEFMDWVDEQDPIVLNQFTNWFVHYLNVQADKVNKELAVDDNKQKKTKKNESKN